LLGWRIDIKSEEEKRQEVETAMAALTVPGAPVSILFDYGLDEKLLEKLFQGGVTTVEKLGSMTPEEIAQVPGVGDTMVETIQHAVTIYYSQFEDEEGAAGEGMVDNTVTTEIEATAPDHAVEAPNPVDGDQQGGDQTPDERNDSVKLETPGGGSESD
jgi:N utilization substance protein A